MYELKSFQSELKDIDLKQGVITAYWSTFDVIDSDMDIMGRDAFNKTVAERGPNGSNRIMFLWQHNPTMPLGKPSEIYMDEKGLVGVTKIADTSYGMDAIKLYESGVINEHSIGFQTIKSRYVENGKDLTDNGKFAFLRSDEYYFTADDDILYPKDYIEHTLQRLKAYPECIVSYHGRRLKAKGVRYYAGHTAFACLGHVGTDQIIDIPGTGVMAFDTNHFMPDVFRYKENRMADVLIGCEAVRHKVQVICLAHGFGWIRNNSPDGGIYMQSRQNDKIQSALCDEIYDLKLS